MKSKKTSDTITLSPIPRAQINAKPMSTTRVISEMAFDRANNMVNAMEIMSHECMESMQNPETDLKTALEQLEKVFLLSRQMTDHLKGDLKHAKKIAANPL
mgnify:CR=1 FL=1